MKNDDPWNRLHDADRDDHPAHHAGSTPVLLILIGIVAVIGLLSWGLVALGTYILELP